MRAGPDNKFYIGIGAPCNICHISDPYGTIARFNPDGTGFEIVARGIRNSVGFDWNPTDTTLWFTDNGRDSLGDNEPDDELNHATSLSNNFGFPYCHAGDIPDPTFGREKPCSNFVAPSLKLGPHVASLGISFYRGHMFPDQYAHTAFIAEHGSWNRTEPIGYRVMGADVSGNTSDSYREFITGWLDSSGKVKGRPVDIINVSDGSILISDDFAGAIYRVTYNH
jgi:glucose/arabinose dehydrogenase